VCKCRYLEIAHLHRFHEFGAIILGNGQTQYLTEKELKAVAEEMLKLASDIHWYEFVDSNYNSASINHECVDWRPGK